MPPARLAGPVPLVILLNHLSFEEYNIKYKILYCNFFNKSYRINSKLFPYLYYNTKNNKFKGLSRWIIWDFRSGFILRNISIINKLVFNLLAFFKIIIHI